LTAVRLSGRDARFVLPGCPAFLQLGDFGELGERRRRQVRQAEEDGFDACETEIAGLDRRSGAAYAAVKAKNDILRLRPKSCAHNSPQSLRRLDLAPTSSRRVSADARKGRRAQRDARRVTRESASAAWGKSIHSGQRQIHRGESILATICLATI
jgi:hypothetical protein